MNKAFSKKIHTRIRLLWLVLLLMIVYMIVVGELGWGDSRKMTDLAVLVSKIIIFGGMIYVIYRLRYNKKLLSNQHLLASQSVKEADEREQFLHDKSGGLVINILLICLLFITGTAALINMIAFNISLLILIITLLLKIGSYTIYSKMF